MTNPTATRLQVCSGVQPAEKKVSGSGAVIAELLAMLAPDELRLFHLAQQKVELPAAPGVDHEIPLDRDTFLSWVIFVPPSPLALRRTIALPWTSHEKFHPTFKAFTLRSWFCHLPIFDGHRFSPPQSCEKSTTLSSYCKTDKPVKNSPFGYSDYTPTELGDPNSTGLVLVAHDTRSNCQMSSHNKHTHPEIIPTSVYAQLALAAS